MSLAQINGTWCPAGDPYFEPILRSGEFFDQWTLDQALLHVEQRRLALDIGAHIGTWAMPLAAEFTTVITFEPDVINFACLARNTEHLPNVRALPLAIAHRSGRFSLSHEATINSGEGYLMPLENGHDDWVAALRLDDARFRGVDMIKIDIEGMEQLALAGAEETIHACRPVIVLEENERVGHRYGGKASDARQMLQDWGMVEVARREFIPGAFDVVMRWPDPTCLKSPEEQV